MNFVGILLAIVAVAALVVGALGWARKLPGNAFVGIKVPEVRKSREMWDAAHQTAGPLWFIAGVSFAFAATLCFTASGWLWIFAALLTVVGIVLIALGGSLGSRTVAVLADHDAKQEAAEGSCCSSGGCGGDGGEDCEDAASEQAAPQVDVEALRRAVKDQ